MQRTSVENVGKCRETMQKLQNNVDTWQRTSVENVEIEEKQCKNCRENIEIVEITMQIYCRETMQKLEANNVELQRLYKLQRNNVEIMYKLQRNNVETIENNADTLF